MRFYKKTCICLLIAAAVSGCGPKTGKPETTAETVIETNAEQVTEPETGPAPEGEDIYMKYSSSRAKWVKTGEGDILYNTKRYKRNTYVKAVMLVGVDRTGGLSAMNDVSQNGQSDAVFIIAHDTARNKARILMLPRDSFIPINKPDGTRVYDHLSLSWAFGDGAEESLKITREAVSGMLMGIPVDYAAAVDIDAIREITDTVGEIKVTVPNDEMQKKHPEWTKGTVVSLNGKEAEEFLRTRDIRRASTAVFRMQQHRAFMLGFYSALKEKAKSDPNIIQELYDAMQSNMITDMKKAEFLKLGLDGINTKGLMSEDILTLPGTAVPASEDYPWDRVFVDYDNAIPVILELFYREAA